MSNTKEITSQQVEAFLREHPQFFLQNKNLLRHLELKHECGDAISLIEYQVHTLREQNQQLQQHLQSMQGNAEQNHLLFNQIQTLYQQLLQISLSTPDIQFSHLWQIFSNTFIQQFKLDIALLYLFDTGNHSHKQIRSFSLKEAKSHLADLYPRQSIYCGNLTPEQHDYLFGKDDQLIHSMALIPLGPMGQNGLWVLGSTHPKRFQADMDTFFLTQMSDMLTQLLKHFRQDEHQPETLAAD